MNSYPCCSKNRFICDIWRAGCKRISLGTICQTVRDGADDFGDSQKKKFLRGLNEVVQGLEYDILYTSFI